MDRSLVPAPLGCGYFVRHEAAAGPSSRNEESLHEQLASFYRNQQQINLEAAKAFAGQQQRVANLEQRSDKLERFVEDQTQINKATVDALNAMQEEIRVGGQKKAKKVKRAIRWREEGVESDEESEEESDTETQSDEDTEHFCDECQRTLKCLEYLLEKKLTIGN